MLGENAIKEQNSARQKMAVDVELKLLKIVYESKAKKQKCSTVKKCEKVNY